MAEADVIRRTERPATVRGLRADLLRLGLAPGIVTICHSSLSSMGWVCGGAVAVIQALESAMSDRGTLVMPTFSPELSEPSLWQSPPVPEAWWPEIRAEMPPFSPELTPSDRGLGVVPECFRRQPGVERSLHPQHSLAAWGRYSREICAGHTLSADLGEESPLAKIYDLDGWVLLIGVGHDANSSLHLGEWRANLCGRRMVRQGAPVVIDGERRWQEFAALDISDRDFALLGDEFARDTGLVKAGLVGSARALLMPQRPLVDYAVRWLRDHRGDGAG